MLARKRAAAAGARARALHLPQDVVVAALERDVEELAHLGQLRARPNQALGEVPAHADVPFRVRTGYALHNHGSAGPPRPRTSGWPPCAACMRGELWERHGAHPALAHPGTPTASGAARCARHARRPCMRIAALPGMPAGRPRAGRPGRAPQDRCAAHQRRQAPQHNSQPRAIHGPAAPKLPPAPACAAPASARAPAVPACRAAPGVRRGKADAVDARRVVHVAEQVCERPFPPACACARAELDRGPHEP